MNTPKNTRKTGKYNLKRNDIEKAKIQAGLEETTLIYRGEIINPLKYVNYDKYDNGYSSCAEECEKLWLDAPKGNAVVWVNNKIFISPNGEDKENKKADATTKFFFKSGKKEKADDIIIIKCDNYGNLITREKEAYEELTMGLKYLKFNSLQYAEMLSIIASRMKTIAERERLKVDFEEFKPDENYDINKKIKEMPKVKKMVEEITKEQKEEYEKIN